MGNLDVEISKNFCDSLGLLFDMFHDEVGQDGADWGSHRTTENLLEMAALKYKEIVVKDEM